MSTNTESRAWLEQVRWNDDGLVPVIAQDWRDGTVLMLAWMNRNALQESLHRREAVYWSRSRGKLWHKGETSGNVQKIKMIRLDCDSDALLLQIEQEGGVACHTGRRSCFFQTLNDNDQHWHALDPVVKDPHEMYGS